MVRGCQAGKHPADATSYGPGETEMQGGSRFVGRGIHVFVKTGPRQTLARSSRPRSRSQLRFLSVSRLSCSFLPRARASSSLARPFSLK
jgi:hypothetical protein